MSNEVVKSVSRAFLSSNTLSLSVFIINGRTGKRFFPISIRKQWEGKTTVFFCQNNNFLYLCNHHANKNIQRLLVFAT